MTIDEARAHQQYDDCMFCPGFLTGLHMNSKCYLDWIEGTADPQKFEEETCPEEMRSPSSLGWQ